MARKAIPKDVRNNIWRRYWGGNMDGECWVCGRNIGNDMFECGHIISVSNGGSDNINNLVPICKGCNLGMKEENLLDYKKRYYSHVMVDSLVNPESLDIEGAPAKETTSQKSKVTAKPIDDDIIDSSKETTSQKSKVTAKPIDGDIILEEEISEKDKRERDMENIH